MQGHLFYEKYSNVIAAYVTHSKFNHQILNTVSATRLTTDVLFAGIGSKLAVKSNIYPLGYTKWVFPVIFSWHKLNLHHVRRPSINLVGSEGIAIGVGVPLRNHVVLSGYNHLVSQVSPQFRIRTLISLQDVLLANRKQTLGRRELCSISAVNFMKTQGTGVIWELQGFVNQSKNRYILYSPIYPSCRGGRFAMIDSRNKIK